MKTFKTIRVGFISKVFILLIRFVDLIQGSILKNYPIDGASLSLRRELLEAEIQERLGIRPFVHAMQQDQM